MNVQQRSRAGISTDYVLIIPCTKEISMVKKKLKFAVGAKEYIQLYTPQ